MYLQNVQIKDKQCTWQMKVAGQFLFLILLSHCLNPFRTKTSKYLFPNGINLYCTIKLATTTNLYFHYKSVKLDVLCRHNKYKHLTILSNLKSCQFAPRIMIFHLCICCQFEDSQIISPKTIPMSHRNI